MTSLLVLVPLDFLVACGLSFCVNWLSAIPWRRAAAAHWTDRARLIWPVRRGGLTAILLIPTCLSLAEVAARWATLPGCFLPWVAGVVGAILGSWPLSREVFPRFTFRSWLRLVAVFCLMRLAFLFVILTGVALMPAKLSVASLFLAGGILLFMLASNFGLFVWVLRAIRLLQAPGERLSGIVASAAQQMGLSVPRTWLLNVPFANAAALPTTGELIFSARLLEIAPDEEIAAICAHELAHLTEGKTVLARRIAGSLTIYPFIFTRPVLDRFGPPGMIGLVGLVLFSAILTVRLARRMEKRADKVAAENQAGEGVYARALERIYCENLTPAVNPTNFQAHPNLYDRMLAAGIQPEYPRPAKPGKMAPASLILWVAYVALMVLAFNH